MLYSYVTNVLLIVYARFFSFFLFFVSLLLFQLLDKLWSQVSSLLPRGTCLQFLSGMGFSIPAANSRFSSNVANSRFRAFRESICAQGKVPTSEYEYALVGGLELKKLTYSRQARG